MSVFFICRFCTSCFSSHPVLLLQFEYYNGIHEALMSASYWYFADDHPVCWSVKVHSVKGQPGMIYLLVNFVNLFSMWLPLLNHPNSFIFRICTSMLSFPFWVSNQDGMRWRRMGLFQLKGKCYSKGCNLFFLLIRSRIKSSSGFVSICSRKFVRFHFGLKISGEWPGVFKITVISISGNCCAYNSSIN